MPQRDLLRLVDDPVDLATSRDVDDYEGFDPYAWCTSNLPGETYTDDVKALMDSVRRHQLTVAISANATGKSHCAARIAACFYATFKDARVYTAAAPPESNLKNILWGEIGSLQEKHAHIFSDSKTNVMHVHRGANSFLTGVTIPTTGGPHKREAAFCADAADLFEMHDGTVVKYGDLIGRSDVSVVSIDEKFQRKKSLAEFFDNGDKVVFEIKLEDGEIIRRTGNHPLYAGLEIKKDHRCHGGKHEKGKVRVHREGWADVSSFKKGDAVLCPSDTGFNFGTLKTDSNKLKFLAYMIGDGCFRGKTKASNRLQFTKGEGVQLSEFISILDDEKVKYTISKKECYNWQCISINDQGLADLVRDCGLYNKLSEAKFVPPFINNLCEKDLSLFLNRLFSTDGWACVTNKAEIGYSSKSERLIRDIQRLLLRFGIRAKVLPKTVTWNHGEKNNSGIYWSLFIWNEIDVVRFADQIGIYGKEAGVNACREYSISLKHVYGKWRFEKPGFRWQKVSSVRVIGARPTVGVYVPEDHTYLTSLVEHNSGKHAPHMLFIFDEGDAIPDEVYKGQESCTSGGLYRVLIMFNPRHESGHVYRLIRDGLANVVELSAFRHPNVVTGENVIPGAVDRNTTARRIRLWARPLRPGEPENTSTFKLPEFLAGVTPVDQKGQAMEPLEPGIWKITEQSLAYMTLGRYPSQAPRQLISRDWINAARARYDVYVAKYGELPPAGTLAICGLDVAEYGDDVNAFVQRYGGFVPPVLVWGDVDPDLTASKTIELLRHIRALRTNVDGTGVGSGVAPKIMRAGHAAHSVKVASSPTHQDCELGRFGNLRDELWWSVREWLKDDPGAMLPPDEELIEELLAPTYDTDKGVIKIMDQKTIGEHLGGRSPNRADGLRLTFYKPKLLYPRMGEQ